VFLLKLWGYVPYLFSSHFAAGHWTIWMWREENITINIFKIRKQFCLPKSQAYTAKYFRGFLLVTSGFRRYLFVPSLIIARVNSNPFCRSWDVGEINGVQYHYRLTRCFTIFRHQGDGDGCSIWCRYVLVVWVLVPARHKGRCVAVIFEKTKS
jgi:hypothetical protein